MVRGRVVGGILGICIGDALGLPVEFRSRSYLKENPIDEMIGFGTHNQPVGAWSTDSSLSLCTAESLAEGFSLSGIASRFVRFADRGYWTPSGAPIDLDPAVRTAITRLTDSKGKLPPTPFRSSDHGATGILARMLPVAVCIGGLSATERFKRVVQVSSLTNGNLESIVGCHIVSETALELLAGRSPREAYARMRHRLSLQLGGQPVLSSFRRVVYDNLFLLSEDEIASDGTVVHTVEAALWSLLNSADFPTSVLSAVNLGGNTDTIGAITGGLAGFAYGIEQLPRRWIDHLARSSEIIALAENLFHRAAG